MNGAALRRRAFLFCEPSISPSAHGKQYAEKNLNRLNRAIVVDESFTFPFVRSFYKHRR
jgi:hypothetical protein